MEDAVVKTVAAFLNTDGGTLLIGVGPDRSLVGLELDYPHVKPPNGDGFVNWLTTHLVERARGRRRDAHARADRRATTASSSAGSTSRRSSRPVWARTSKEPRVFFVRMNNSSRAMPDDELRVLLRDRWPSITL